MNYLAIDYGSKRIGLTYSQQGIIFTLNQIKNDNQLFENLKNILDQYKIDKIFVGLSEGHFADITLNFVSERGNMVKLPIETVEESVSTLEAEALFKKNHKPTKKFQQDVDSIAAAIILNRVINS